MRDAFLEEGKRQYVYNANNVYKCLWYSYVNLMTTEDFAVMRMKRIKILVLASDNWSEVGRSETISLYFQASTFRLGDPAISDRLNCDVIADTNARKV